MRRFSFAFAVTVVVLASACTTRRAPPPAQPIYVAPPGYAGQPYPPQQPRPYPQPPYPQQQQPYPQQQYPQQPYPPRPMPAPQAAPSQGVPSTNPGVVAKCKKAEDDWLQACGCPVRIVVDMSTTSVIQKGAFFTAGDFEMQGRHFCDDISTSSGKPISTFCKGRERDMCKISEIRFARVPDSGTTDCTFNNGVAVPQSNGQGASTIDNCYRRVTRW